MTSRESKVYLLQLKNRESIRLTESAYKKLTETDSTGQMMFDRVKSIKIGERIIRSNDISGFERYYEQETERFIPVNTPAKAENIRLLAEMKATYAKRKEAGQKFDPYLDMPKKWRDKLPDPDSLWEEKNGERYQLSWTEREAIDAGVARIVWKGERDVDGVVAIYTCVEFDPKKHQEWCKKKWYDKKFVDDPLQALIDESN